MLDDVDIGHPRRERARVEEQEAAAARKHVA